MVKCISCGVDNTQGTNYCVGCGKILTTVSPSEVPKKKSSLKIALIVFGCLIGSCVLCGILGGIKESIYPTPKNDSVNSAMPIPTKDITTPQSIPSVVASMKPEAPEDTISRITWNELDKIYNLKSDSTDLQKQELWKTYKGKKISWKGTVSEVSNGTFGGLVLQVKMNADTLTSDIYLNLNKNEERKARNLTKGVKVSFTGTLSNYGGAILPMTLDDGEIK